MNRKRLLSILLAVAVMMAVPVSVTAADPVPARHGLRGDYYTLNSGDLSFGTWKSTHVDNQISLANTESLLARRVGQSDYAAVRWTGKIIPQKTADYVFSAYSDNGIRLYVGHETTPIINWWVNQWDIEQFAPSMRLEAGQTYYFKMEWFEFSGGSHTTLYWNDGTGKVTVPPGVFYLPDDFRPPVITGVDFTGAVLTESAIAGNAVLSVSDLTPTTTVGIVTSAGDAIGGLSAPEEVNRTQDTVTVKIPTALRVGSYRFFVADNGIDATSDSFIITSSQTRSEYPRPDYARTDKWMTLNGPWDFKFDPTKVGESQQWFAGKISDRKINVPYPWESPLSGVVEPDYLGTAWYQRDLTLDSSWSGRRIVIRFGAVDWMCTLYVNGVKAGSNVGGYTPFEFDITDYVNFEGSNRLTLMVNDEASYGKTSYTALVGKQGHNAPCGYTHTSGIWQSVILEGRYSATQLAYAHIDPMVDESAARFNINVVSPAAGAKTLTLKYSFKSTLWDNTNMVNKDTGSLFSGQESIPISAQGDNLFTFTASIPGQKLWWPDECNLYEGTLELYDGAVLLDKVSTYFGQRKLSRGVWHAGTDYEYVYLNNKPIFISGLLDQGFWEDGIYTAPTEAALKFDIVAMRSAGFNLIRKHLKIEDPLQYYWCDRLGMMVWADMPHATNMSSASNADISGRAVYEKALTDMINRDYNHPSVISYILFNETWGITHNVNTDNWIRSMYALTKAKDPSGRLVEDMSPCNNDHLQPTDLNTFHIYTGSYTNFRTDINNRDAATYPGSRNNFNSNGVTGGNAQDGDPWLNSEYGGVGAYDGDHDVSWCFKNYTDVQRLRQKLCGYVYTEPYDIEYECNGLLNYNRSWKVFGYDEIAYGGDMSIRHLNQADYVGIDKDPITTLTPGQKYTATVGMIRWSDYTLDQPVLKWRLDGTDIYGSKIDTGIAGQVAVTYSPYTYETRQISFSIPEDNRYIQFAGTVTVWIEDAHGKVIAKNFTNLKVTDGSTIKEVDNFADNAYALRQTTANTSTVANGVGALTYRYTVPDDFNPSALDGLRILAELSAVKPGDTQTAVGEETPSDVTVSINGHEIDTILIPDAPRDMRGTLSLNAGRPSAGEFGYLVNLNLSRDTLALIASELATSKTLTVKYEVKDTAARKNGVKAYNESVGRYAVSPMIILNPPEHFRINDDVSLKHNGTLNYNVPKSNFGFEADLPNHTISLKAGYALEVNGSAVTVKENGAIIAQTYAGTAIDHIKVTFFDRQIRVYVNNNPERVIDVYGKSLASTSVALGALSGAGTVIRNLAYIPETYDNSATLGTEADVQFVEAFNTQTAFDRWQRMGTNFTFAADGNVGGRAVFTSGTGPKIIYNNVSASNVVVEGDFTMTSVVANTSGNVGFIIRGTQFVNSTDGANGYYIGFGVNDRSGLSNGFVQVGRMANNWTELARVATPIPVSLNQKIRLRAVAIGPRIMVYVNGIKCIDLYDSVYQTGSLAIRTYQSAGTVDNVVFATAPVYEANFNPRTGGGTSGSAASLDEWTTNGAWNIVNNTLRADGVGNALVGSTAWSDVSVTAGIKPGSDAAGLLLRAGNTRTGLNGYVLKTDATNGRVAIGKLTGGVFSELQSAAIPKALLADGLFSMTAVNNVIKVYYNGGSSDGMLPVLSVVDNTYTNGRAGLISFGGAPVFDDFFITDSFRYEEAFHAGTLAGWKNIKGTWTLADNVLSVTPGVDDKLVDGYATLSDFQMDFDFRMDGPLGAANKYNAGVVFRATDFGAAQDNLRGYVLGINYSRGSTDPSGLELGDIRYGWRAIKTAETTRLNEGTWYHLTVRCEGQNIKAYVDGELYLDVNDAAYTHGQFALRNFNAGASYKNLVIKQLTDKASAHGDFALSAKLDNGVVICADNYTAAAKQVKVIVAVYGADGTLKTGLTESTALQGGLRSVFKVDLGDSYQTGDSVKVFAWDDATMVPVCEAFGIA